MAAGISYTTKVIKVGDWSKTTKLLRWGPTALHTVIPIAVKQEAQFLRKAILKNLKTQGGATGKAFVQHAATTKLSKRFKNRPGGKVLVESADMRNAIEVEARGNEAFIGILRSARGKDGRPLANIADVHEHGRTISIPITRAMLRFLHTMFRQGGTSRGQGGASQPLKVGGVLTIRIPPRPFISPVVEELYGNDTIARGRFFGRVGRLLRRQYGSIPPVPSKFK